MTNTIRIEGNDAIIILTTSFRLTEQTLKDVLTTALEGGIGYWSMASNIGRDDQHNVYTVTLEPATNRDIDADEFDKKVVNLLDVAKGMALVMEEGFTGCHASIKQDVRDLAVNGSGGSVAWDAETCDIIMQAAVLGEVRFG